MVEHVGSARAPEDRSSRPAIKFPLWAGDVPVADADWQTTAPDSPAAPADSHVAAVVTPPACRSLSELAAARRRATPPPLPKAAASLEAAPIANGGALEAQSQELAQLDPSPLPLPSTFAQRVQELPCWLTSLVLHLCLVILLNSYVMYASGTNRGGVAPQGTILSVSCIPTGGPEATPDAEPSLFSISPSAGPLTDASLTTAALADDADPFSLPEIQVLLQPGAVDAAALPSHGAATGDAATQPAAPAEGEPVAPQSRRHTRHGTAADNAEPTTRAVPPTDAVPAPAADLPDSEPNDEQANDDIVDRFIAYDIGQLRGEEAVRAHRDFQTLRPNSIPSLVRGLNRAAQIRGTCPVMVLSAKLDEMLRQTNDPSLIRYAFENLGRGVPAGAAHSQRIAALRKQLLASQTQQVAGALQQQGITADDVLLNRLAPLFTAGADRLNKALGNSNGVIRQVAALQVETRLDEFNELERRRLARSLIRLLRDPRAETAAAAHSALRKLAQGDDFGPGPNATPVELAEATRDWGRRFTSEGDVSDDRVANGLLSLARLLQQKGRTQAATQRYQDICERFPGSAAATEAQHQLDSLEAAPQ